MLQNKGCSAESVMKRADKLAEYSSDKEQLTRAYLTDEHKQANEQLANWMSQASLQTWVDSVGNQWGRKVSANPTQRTIIIGSHSDTVTNAGKYDGNLGILLAIEAMEQLAYQSFPFHIDIVAFADEEGVRFDTTLIGSSAVAGCFDKKWLAIEDDTGLTMEEAMLEFGLDPALAGQDMRHPEEIEAYLEVHIEQGPVLEKENRSVGVVTGIAGAKRFMLTASGVAGHAGTVPIELRHDALCAVAEMINSIEVFSKTHSLVATVGKCEVLDGAVNVIPGSVEFSLDIRCLEQSKLELATAEILEKLQAIAHVRGVSLHSEKVYQADAVQCSRRLQRLWASAVEAVTEGPVHSLPSGAGHDALAMQHLTDVGMLFVRCEKGISHNPKEAVSPKDVNVALQCLIEAVIQYERAV
ncbi:allantoate amidohydrolase [Vibrio sp. FNV 38]|nr:allantoate amidohydrolase [Vibrio sp. FNV 38]